MFASMFGVILASFIVIIISAIIIGGMVSSATKEDEIEVKDNSILHIQLDTEISDRGSNNPMENFNIQTLKSNNVIGLKDIIACLKKAETDKRIKGIYLDFTSIPAGMATVEEIRNALIDFKKTGKFIVSYSDFYSQKTYYLASVAKKIYLNPEGDLNFVGLSAQIMFFKKALEKLGVEPEVIRHGKFKSAVEPFILDKMSDENREQISVYVGSIWNNVLKGISEQRNIPVDDLKNFADQLLIRDAKSAMTNKMIDSVKYKDQIIDELKQLSGIKLKDDLNLITLNKYTKAKVENEETEIIKNKIAIIYATGEIQLGEGDTKTIGSDGLSAAIRKARKDTAIKAIVLRVNSPGGSALASEIIWREVVLARKVKPVIASMGDVAASGGYYISCAADTIVASPTTITGSIGVFGLTFNAQNLLNEKLGITFDHMNTNKYSDIGTPTRKMTPEEKAIMQEGVEHIYEVFIQHVADGRKIPVAKVDSMGQGRVWSGENAIRLGLVDVFGGIDTAVKIAASKAKLKKYRIVSLPEEKDPFQQILQNLSNQTSERFIQNNLGENYRYYRNLQSVFNMKGIQARMVFDIEF